MTMIDEIKELADAPDFETFKELRHKADVPAEPAEKTPQVEEATPVSAATEGTAEPITQEPAVEAPVEKSTDDQIKELRSKGKHAAANKLMLDAATKTANERAEKAERELEALKSRPSVTPETKPEPVKPQSVVDPNEPKATDDKYAGENGYEDYILDKATYRLRKETQQTEQQKQNATVVAKVNTKWNAAKAKYADFEAVTATNPVTPVIAEFVRDHDLGMDVLYQLGKNRAEYDRIGTLSPAMQFSELGYMARLIATPPAAVNPPVVLKPAVSLAKVPPRVLSGADEPEAKSTAEAVNFDDFKRIRRQRKAS